MWQRTSHIKQFDWVVDNLNTHMSLELCALVACLCGLPWRPKDLKTQGQRRAWLSDPEHKHVFHYLPIHGSWLNQVELWFSVLARQFLRRGDFTSIREFEERQAKKARAAGKTRRAGKQPGDSGKTLEMTDTPDEVIVHAPESCSGCGAGLADAELTTVARRQVIDIARPTRSDG